MTYDPTGTIGHMELTRRHACARLTLSTEQCDDVELWEWLLDLAVVHAGAEVLGKLAHKFQPQGCSVVLLLSESHASVHTWPELQAAEVDVYTCGDVDPEQALQYVIDKLNPSIVERYAVALA